MPCLRPSPSSPRHSSTDRPSCPWPDCSVGRPDSAPLQRATAEPGRIHHPVWCGTRRIVRRRQATEPRGSDPLGGLVGHGPGRRLSTGTAQSDCRRPAPHAGDPRAAEPAALALGRGPAACRTRAAGWPSVCTEIGRPELAECAELGVSELVTNALLHGRAADHGAGARHREHPRVEVRDASLGAAAPADEPSTTRDDDDLLLTFGRGLSIVARCSDRLGRRDRGGRQGRLVRAGGGARRRRRRRRASITGLDHPALEAPPDADDRVRDRASSACRCASFVGFQHALPRAAPRGAAAGPGARVRLPAGQDASPTCSAPWTASCARASAPSRSRRPCAAAASRTDLRVAMPRATADHPRALHRAARPGRRVLPRRSGCCRWPAARSSGSSSAGSSASSCGRPAASSPLSWLEARSNGRANVVT